jgi:hypothetical protein
VKQTATAKVEPKAEAPKPAPAAKTTPAATPTKRQPVVEESESVDGGDPWAPGRAACIEAGFNEFSEITPDEVEKIKKPNCFTKEAEPTDSMCQGCRVLLPCLTARLAAAA